MSIKNVFQHLTMFLLLYQQSDVSAVCNGNLANVALWKTAKQSSEQGWPNNPAIKAVDGNYDGKRWSNTKSEISSWWMVDLGGSFDVCRVTLWNRDTQSNRLKSILILTSNDNIAPGVVNETDKWDMQNYRESPYTMNISVAITDGRPVRLRHIAVYNNGSSGVSLTEFEAFGIGLWSDWSSDNTCDVVCGGNNGTRTKTRVCLSGKSQCAGMTSETELCENSDPLIDVTNLALEKNATQSSQYGKSVANRAVDGKTAGDEFSHTQLLRNSWWKVDLGARYYVCRVTIWNRDKWKVRLKTVLVMTTPEDKAPGVVNETKKWEIQFQRGFKHLPRYSQRVFDAGGVAERVKARHIAVYNNGTNLGVTLAEFEAYGTGMWSPWTNTYYCLTCGGSSGMVERTRHCVSGEGKCGNGTTRRVDVCKPDKAGHAEVSNLALNKRAYHRPGNYSKPASIAVDGNTDANLFSQSNKARYHWWRVDLGASYTICWVTLWSRSEKSLRTRQTLILSSMWNFPPLVVRGDIPKYWIVRSYRVERYPLKETEVFDIPIGARHLAVYNNGTGGTGVALVEFEAFGTGRWSVWSGDLSCSKLCGTRTRKRKCLSGPGLCDGPTKKVEYCESKETLTELKNIAFGKKAAQFSTIGNNLAKKAVDGNLNTMAATDLEPEQRWIVDLGAVYYICRVTLWNHMYLAYRTHGLTILSAVNSTNFSSRGAFWDVQGYRNDDYESENDTIHFPATDDNKPVKARYIAVYNNVSDYGLKITEFNAFGTGIWSKWIYSACSRTCGKWKGTRTRRVECLTGKNRCRNGPAEETLACTPDVKLCPGTWTPWSPFTLCSARCRTGYGNQTRRRSCLDAEDRTGRCPEGFGRETVNCTNPALCLGKWKPWSPFGPCSVTCGRGDGTRTRNRTCFAEDGQIGRCYGLGIDSQDCTNKTLCPDRNQCSLDSDCPPNSNCIASTCTCKRGLTGDPSIGCKDVDECVKGTHTCDCKAACFNTYGSYFCKCTERYHGDGWKCTADKEGEEIILYGRDGNSLSQYVDEPVD